MHPFHKLQRFPSQSINFFKRVVDAWSYSLTGKGILVKYLEKAAPSLVEKLWIRVFELGT